MKKFGFGKKSDKGAAQDANPYAQQPAEDPYANAPPMTPYQQAKAGLPSGPRAGGLPSGPGPRPGGYGTPPPPYSGTPQQSAGYGNEKFGAAGGYGGNRYDNNAASFNANQRAPAMTSPRPGGYGGFGAASNATLDEKRDDLFAGAKDRYQERQQAGPGASDGQYGQSGSSGNDNSYGGYGERRELTAEEQEEEDYQNMKSEIKGIKKESLASAQRSLATAQGALETLGGTMARLGAQGERLYNTEKNLDLASNYNRVAEEKTKELHTLNRSMFAVHVANPFTSNRRKAEQDERILRQHQSDRDQREATRQAAYASNQRMEDAFKGMSVSSGNMRLGQRSAAERNQYKLEDSDSEDEQIDDTVDQISGVVSQLRQGALAFSAEVDEQNKRIDLIAAKSDAVDDGVRMNQARLNRIK